MHAEKYHELCETAHISISVIDRASFIGAPELSFKKRTSLRIARFRVVKPRCLRDRYTDHTFYRLIHFDLNPRITAAGNQSRQSRSCNNSSAPHDRRPRARGKAT